MEGCCHGELDKIYESLAFLEQKEGVKVDLLVCCGDFQARPPRATTALRRSAAQAVRNEDDLACMSVPDKYKSMGTFYKARGRGASTLSAALSAHACAQYYTGEAVAPYPTLFVGGNHEASNHLWEARSCSPPA